MSREETMRHLRGVFTLPYLLAILAFACPEAVVAGEDKLERLFDATNAIVEDIESVRTKEDMLARIKPYKPLWEEVRQMCKDGSKEACDMEQKFLEQVGRLDVWVENRAYRESPDRDRDWYCAAYGKVLQAKSNIDDEREKGRISGVVNLNRLKSWGDIAHDHQKMMVRYSAEHRKKTGRELKKEDCK